MKKLLEILNDNPVLLGYIITAIGTIAGAIWGWVKRKAGIKDERIGKALMFLEEGVEDTWHAYVKGIKAGIKDKKLTPAERKKALQMAKDAAIGYAKEEGWPLLTYIAESTIPVIIKKIVDGRKSGNA